MVKCTEGTFANGRKQTLHTVQYLPDSGSPSGIVYWHHGITEHIARYAHVFQRICEEANVAIYSHDAYGHGKSEPKDEKLRCYILDFEDIIDDTLARLDSVRPQHPGLPLFMAGTSMGGLCATHVVLRKQADFAGLILCSAAIDVEWTPVLRMTAAIGGCLSVCLPHARMVPAVRLEDMNASPELQKAILDDPLIFHGNLQNLTGYSVLQGFKALEDPKKRSKLTLPIYAMHGTKDKTTSLPAVKKLLEMCGSKDKTMNEVKGGYHEVLHGPEKDDVVTSIVEWLVRHMSAGSAAGDGAADPTEINVEQK